ncbi:hypothetical protein BpHYR1_017047 [Brachionus plicatilis]|uniref:Uncharacterized protein n=1 Tax=Brachionus plicatilis TaxID=10195 RepID=A0A3M7SR04_BRAPC|nr:hypothetical protein BpHYR1_017047 [Brachionus plicatilis]
MQLLDTSNRFDSDSGLRLELGTECPLAVPFRLDVVDRELSDRDLSPFGQRFPLNSALKAKLFHENILFFDCVSYHSFALSLH